MPTVRLDKFLADQGVASRKELREIIRSGRVQIEGYTVRKPEQKLDPEKEKVSLDGNVLGASALRYFLMDKPEGVLTATEDAEQQTVLDLLPPELQRLCLFPVGRLDKDTSGLLLLTNDGDFAHRVISPKSAVEKRYYARVDGNVDAEDAEAFRTGVVLRDGTKCLPARLEADGPGACFVTVVEGKYHQVKRMLASRGKPVLTLRRVAVGTLELTGPPQPGHWKELTKEDLCRVFSTDALEKMSKIPSD